MFIMKLTMNIVFEEKKFSLIFCANLYLILNIPLKDVEKSLKSKYLIRTYNKTSPTTWTFDTKIWVICLYNLYYYNKFKVHLVWLFFGIHFFPGLLLTHELSRHILFICKKTMILLKYWAIAMQDFMNSVKRLYLYDL